MVPAPWPLSSVPGPSVDRTSSMLTVSVADVIDSGATPARAPSGNSITEGSWSAGPGRTTDSGLPPIRPGRPGKPSTMPSQTAPGVVLSMVMGDATATAGRAVAKTRAGTSPRIGV